MQEKIAAVTRRAVVLAVVAGLFGAIGASAASALPGIGARPSGPVRGPYVGLGCANAGNTNSGRLLAAARAPAGVATCDGYVIAHAAGQGPQIMSGPVGYGPSQIQSAYKLTGLSGSGRTVAIVDAYNDPKAASDLAVFRGAYGLSSCTTSNGCLSIVNENGAASPLPANNDSWAEEESLDLDTVSSTCPTCNIVLVEASSESDANLAAAENAAAAIPGVVSISNSYGSDERASQLAFDADYNHPGLAITAAAGDQGYGAEWPASSRYVTAVGGTTLSSASNARGWSETAWSGTGSGCSAYEPKPAWQTDTGCARRTNNDVSADADPNTGLGLYDTDNPCGSSRFCDFLIELGYVQGFDGWVQVGGTSLSSPLIASVYALAGNTGSITDASYAYSHQSSLFDVTSGSNGVCARSYLCTAGVGYDAPTGLGTPDGTGAF